MTSRGLTLRRQVFVDTAAWLALINVDDDFHLLAKQVRKKLQQDNCSLITSDFVLLEVADALTTPRVRSQTINFIDRLRSLSGLKIVPISQSLFDAGWQLYSQRLDKDWGLTDCISFVIMQQEGITIAFTSDKHSTSVRATEAPVKYDLVSTADAVRGAIPVTLYFGKITLLDFTEAGEYITFIAPSDRSQFVYNTDLPANSGEAQSVYLLPIKKVDFKGTYQTSHPNLIVKTINSSGQSKQYNFILNFSSGVMTSTGIKIINPIDKSLSNPRKIRVSAGQTINASDIERGLRIAIVKQFVKADDPVVNKVRNFIFMLRNGNSVNDAITYTGVNPSVVESLGEMYLERELTTRLEKNPIATEP